MTPAARADSPLRRLPFMADALDSPSPETFVLPQDAAQALASLRATDCADWMGEEFYIPSGGRIVLAPHQKVVLRCMLTRGPDGRFPYTTCIFSTIKKSGKTTISGGIGRWGAETQFSYGEVYFVGNKLDQAQDRGFREMRRSIELTPGYIMGRDVLPGRWDVQAKSMLCLTSRTKVMALAVNAPGEAGGAPALSIWCVKGDTETLCRSGWKQTQDLTVDDEVAALDPTTGIMRWEHPRGVNVTPYSGKMIRFRHRRAEFTVTPNHRVWGRFITHSRYKSKAEDRGWWFEEASAAAKFSAGWLAGTAGWRGEREYDPAMARFLGFYISEGHCSGDNVVISQSRDVHPETYEEIRQAFVALGLEPRCYAKNISVRNPALADELRPLGKSWEKFVPQHLKDAQPGALAAFFSAYISGDGWQTGSADGWQCETSSKRLADDLMEVALKLGYHPRLMGSRMRKPSVQPDGSGKPLTPRHLMYRVSFSIGPIYWERTYEGKRGGSWEEIDYDGTVACPSLEHGIFYIRENGKCCWTGNTELWGMEHEGALRFWDELTTVPTIPDSIRLVETYAGFEGESKKLWELYCRGKEGRQLTNGEAARLAARDRDGERYEDLLLAWAECHGDPDELVPIWVDANGLFMYWDSGIEARRMPWQLGERGDRYYIEQETENRPAVYIQHHRNEWAGAESNFVPMEIWDACVDPDLPPFLPGDPMPCVIAVDAASTGDCFGIVVVTRWPNPDFHDGHVAIRATKLWTPPRGGRIDYIEPEGFLRWAVRGGCAAGHPQYTLKPGDGGAPFRRTSEDVAPGGPAEGKPACGACDEQILVPGYKVVQIAYDPYQMEDMSQRLMRDRVIWCEAFDQKAPRLRADRRFYDLVIQRKIAHTGERNLREHVRNSNAKVQKDQDSTLRIVKKSEGGGKIDLCVAASMAVSRCLDLLMPKTDGRAREQAG